MKYNIKSIFIIVLLLTFPLFDAGYKFFIVDKSAEISFLYSQEESEKKKTENKKIVELGDSIIVHYNLATLISPPDAHFYKKIIYDYTISNILLRPPIAI